MSESIQPLLERIQNEGLKKAETERERILSEAQAAADAVLEKARAEAARIREEAEKEAQALLSRGQTALTQAARDQLLHLRSELSRQVNRAAEKAASSSLSSEALLSELLPFLAERGSGNLKVEANGEFAEKIESLLAPLLREAGREGEVVMNPKTGSGFQLHFSDSPEAIDMTSQAVADWLSQYLRPELAELLKKETSGE